MIFGTTWQSQVPSISPVRFRCLLAVCIRGFGVRHYPFLMSSSTTTSPGIGVMSEYCEITSHSNCSKVFSLKWFVDLLSYMDIIGSYLSHFYILTLLRYFNYNFVFEVSHAQPLPCCVTDLTGAGGVILYNTHTTKTRLAK